MRKARHGTEEIKPVPASSFIIDSSERCGVVEGGAMEASESIFVRAGYLFDGLDSYIEDGCISIGGDGRIRAVGAGLSPQAGSRVLEFPDSTIMPGLVDCHVHLTLDGGPSWLQVSSTPLTQQTLQAVAAARATLLGGITTARSLGAPAGIDIAVRDSIKRNEIPGPRLLCSGPVICTTGGHGSWMGRPADGPDDLRRAVRATFAEGADLIKVMATGGVLTAGSAITAPAFTSAELAACVDEAHRFGVQVVAHALNREGVESAVRAGCDFIEHGDGLDADVADLMVEAGAYLGATLTSALDFLTSADNGLAPQWALDKVSATTPARIKAFRIAVERGVRLVMSTDAGTPFHPHGRGAAEITAMVEHGLAPLAALRVATSGGAEAMRLLDEVGTLEAGKLADVVVFGGNVVADPGVFRSEQGPDLVIKGGVVYRNRES